MSLLFRASLVLTASLLLTPAVSAQGTKKIAWSKNLETAFTEAKAQGKILMICVNAKYVDGKKTEERAAKGLREVVYRDERVVTLSREFVCAFFTPVSKKGDFGELRLLGIEGDIISPQHIFVRPKGDKILLREEYWSHGREEAGVKALLAMMEKAKANLADENKPAESKQSGKLSPDAPDGDARANWIKQWLDVVVTGDQRDRRSAIRNLIRNNKNGDCTTPLILLLTEHSKNTELIVDVIRGLGRDKLLDAAAPIATFLKHRKEEVRGNAAVSLEYIGDRHKDVVSALRVAAGKEKDASIANHMFRALGRCGVEDSKVRSLLLKKCAGAKSEFASYGPTIGLAYFEGDKKAARGVEKILKRIGIPGGRRGGAQNTVKRSVVCWTLAWIGDPKSGVFMREELMEKLKNIKAFWVAGLRSFYASVARKCEGRDKTMDAIRGGVRGAVGFAKGGDLGRYGAETRDLMDKCRKDRKDADFKPRGDNLIGAGGSG